jgi:SAM-dependent methyltransferase
MFVHVQHVQHPTDREQVYRFRYRILVEALRQSPASADHKQRIIKDALDDSARLLVAVDEQNGSIVGTLRSNFGGDKPLPRKLVKKLGLGPMVDAVGAGRISYTSALVVDPAFGGETIASTLATQLYSVALAKRLEVDVLAVEPGLAATCHQLGYRPYTEPIQARSEQRLPLALVLRQGDYLGKVKSPFAKVTYHPPGAGESTASKIAQCYPYFRDQDVVPQKLDSFWAALAHVNAPAPPPSLFEGIDPKAIQPVLDSLPRVQLATDEWLGDVAAKGMGMLLSGRLGLTVGDGPRPFFVSVLRSGEVFGQMGGFAASGANPDVVALEDSELLLLPQDLPERIEKRHPSLAKRIRRNLANILVYRLELLNKRVAGFMGGSPERIAADAGPPEEEIGPQVLLAEEPSDPALDQLPEPAPAEPKPRTSARTTLVPEEHCQPADDPEVPPELLQAGPALARILPRDVETRWLKRVGLRDVSTILVLDDGSGEGVLRLSQLLPRTRVVGVLPPDLMPLLQQRLDEAEVAERCTLVPLVDGRIPLAADSADHAWLRSAFTDGADPDATLAELRRVLRPGGVVAAQDLDDGGLMIQPEPPGLGGFLERVNALSGEASSRQVGRRLVQLLRDAGFERPRGLVLPLTPPAISAGELADATFGPMAQQLHARGGWTAEDTDTMRALKSLGGSDDAWICVPVVCAAARVPAEG